MMKKNQNLTSKRPTKITILIILFVVLFLVSLTIFIDYWSQFGKNDEDKNYKEIILAGSLVLLVVSTFIILLLESRGGKITTSLQLIEKGLDQLSKGDFSYRVPIPVKRNDVWVLTIFNEMAEQLERSMKELESAKKNLENQVNTRTKEMQIVNEKLGKAVADLKLTQNKIIQTEKQKSLTAIVTGFAHEINNPLSGILGYIDLMEIHNDTSPYIKKKLASIKTQSLRIKDIIHNLNQLRPDREQVRLEINVTNLLEKLIKIVRSQQSSLGITFGKEFCENSLHVYGNHFSLWQVFEAIIENSIEAIKEQKIANGRINISLNKNKAQSFALIEISDNGGGFTNIEKAFDPFYTTKDRTKKKGIGLSIAYNLLQEHGGSIQIGNHGKGAMVKLKLPLFDRQDKSEKNKTGG